MSSLKAHYERRWQIWKGRGKNGGKTWGKPGGKACERNGIRVVKIEINVCWDPHRHIVCKNAAVCVCICGISYASLVAKWTGGGGHAPPTSHALLTSGPTTMEPEIFANRKLS